MLSNECLITSLTMFYKRTGELRTVGNIQDCKWVLFTMNDVVYYRDGNGQLIEISHKIF